jgi:hypothetical protein
VVENLIVPTLVLRLVLRTEAVLEDFVDTELLLVLRTEAVLEGLIVPALVLRLVLRNETVLESLMVPALVLRLVLWDETLLEDLMVPALALRLVLRIEAVMESIVPEARDVEEVDIWPWISVEEGMPWMPGTWELDIDHDTVLVPSFTLSKEMLYELDSEGLIDDGELSVNVLLSTSEDDGNFVDSFNNAQSPSPLTEAPTDLLRLHVTRSGL